MNPPVDSGLLMSVTYVQDLYSQRILNIRHYAVTWSGPGLDPNNLTEVIAEYFGNDDAGIIAAMASVQSNQVNWDEVRAQIIYPGRYPYEVASPSKEEGDILFNASTANAALVITLTGQNVGRHNIGSIHVAGVPAQSQEFGRFHNDILASADAIGNSLVQSLTTIVAGTTVNLQPVFFNRTSPLSSALVTGYVVQESVRTQRSRTLGRGE